jgi:hypothetical protein
MNSLEQAQAAYAQSRRWAGRLAALVVCGLVARALAANGPTSGAPLLAGTYHYDVPPEQYQDKGAATLPFAQGALTDGSDETGPGWGGGRGDGPTAIGITFDLERPCTVRRLRLVSQSPNSYWYITVVNVLGRSEPGAAWAPLATREWYHRSEGKDKADEGGRVFRLDLDLPTAPLRELRLEIGRPHSWIWMGLSEVEIEVADIVTADVVTPRTAWTLGQPLRAGLRLRNATPGTLRGLHLELRRAAANGPALYARDLAALPPGETRLEVELAPPLQAGSFRLQPTLSGTPEAVPTLTRASAELYVMRPRSPYYYPVGPCIDGPEVPELGFSVTEYWDQLPGDPRLTTAARQGYYQTLCSEPLQPVDPGSAEVHALGADGTPCPRLFTMAWPRFDVDPEFAARARAINGHPGFHTFLYNNEMTYALWVTSGAFVDYHPLVVQRYRTWLARRYGGLEGLNAAWGTTHPDVAAITPPSARGTQPAPWYDWMSFRSELLAEHMQGCYRVLKGYLPDTLVTAKPLVPDDLFAQADGLDYHLWRGSGDVFGISAYAFQRMGYDELAFAVDHARAELPGVPIHFAETGLKFVMGETVRRTAADVNRVYWPAVVRGARALYLFSWFAPWDRGTFDGYWLWDGDQGRLTETGAEAARLARSVRTLAPVLNTATPFGLQAAVLFPHADVWQTGGVASMHALYGAYKLLNQLGYPADIICWRDLNAERLANYRLLVLPGSQHLPPAAAAAIERWVREGGILVGDVRCGHFDPHGHEQRSLEAVFGIEDGGATDELNTVSLLPGDPATILISRIADADNSAGAAKRYREQRATRVRLAGGLPLGVFADGSPALVTNTHGQGRTLYAAWELFAGYRNYTYSLTVAPHPICQENEVKNAGDPAVRGVLRRFLAERGLEAPLQVSSAEDLPTSLRSCTSSRDAAVFGLTHFGLEPLRTPHLRLQQPFPKVRAAYLLDTATERLTTWPFRAADGWVTGVLPDVTTTALVVLVGEHGPLVPLVRVDGTTIRVDLVNHLPEAVEGTAELRTPQGREISAARLPVRLEAGGHRRLEFPLPAGGPEVPVWVRYDGDALAVNRVPLPAGAR